MNSKRMLDKSSVGIRFGGASIQFCSAVRDSVATLDSGVVPVCKNGPAPGSVLYTFVVDAGGSVRDGTRREDIVLKGNESSSRGDILHDIIKTACGGLEDQRDPGPAGVLKRASPTCCLTTNGQLPGGFMHSDIRTPGKLANGFQATQGRNLPPEESQPIPSSHIPVPRHRKPSGHADKEVMAATVLTSLSTSSLVLLPAPTNTSSLVLHPAPTNTAAVPELASRGWKESLSASYSSSTSGNWSWDASDQSVPSTPSPPLSNDANKSFLLSSQGDDAGEDVTESTHFLFEDPIPRKRKNSMKVMFKCLWKNCDKVLSTSSGIQRHIRTVHLGRNSDSDYSDGEEDFYYSEIEVNMDSLSEGLSSLTPTSPTTAGPPPVFPPSLADDLPRSEHISVLRGQPSHAPTLLSQSAPSTLCHIRTDHAYQATAPVSIPVGCQPGGPGGVSANCNGNGMGISDGTGVSVSWQSPPFRGAPGPLAHVRTVSIGEKRQPAPNIHTTATKNHALTSPAPKPTPGTRKPRGEAKKCRKVYGMEKRDMWCTACRWKKACQRFTD